MTTLSINTRAATSLILNVTGIPAGTTSCDLQYSTRADFQFCVSPVITFAPGATVGLPGLNRKQLYFIRARGQILTQTTLFSFTGGALPSGATLTRASSAYRTNIAGSMVLETANVARFDYHPTTHAVLGILIEPAATNLMLQSQTIDVAPWGAGGGGSNPAATANAIAAPDGATTADAIVPGVTNGNQHRTQNVTVPSAGVYTESGFFKPNFYTHGALGTVASGGFPFGVFDLTGTGSVLLSTGLTSATIQQIANGWYYCTITYSVDAGHLVGQHSAAVTNTTGISFAGNAANNGYFWQGQVEAGAVATSPIITTTAAASRSADALVLNMASKGYSDGLVSLRYTFDDDSTQDVVGTISGGNLAVPTNLNRPRIKTIGTVNITVEAWSTVKGFSTLVGVEPTPVTSGVLVQPAIVMVARHVNLWGSAGTVTGYPPDNMAVHSPAAAFRAFGTANVFSFWLETSQNPIDTIAIMDTNFSEAATVVIKAGDTLGMVDGTGTAPTLTTTSAQFRASAGLPGRRSYHSLIRFASPIEYRYIRVEITEPAGLLGNMCHITHFAAGLARQARNYSDMTDQGFDLSTVNRLRDGTLDLTAGYRGRQVDFEIAVMAETTYETTFGDLFQAAGYSAPVLVVPNSKTGNYLHDRMLFGNLTGGKQTNSNMRFTRTFTVQSIIN